MKGSGELENAPDNVIFCHREEYYLEREESACDPEERNMQLELLENAHGKMELIVAKQRMGPIGAVMIKADMATNTFSNVDPEQSPQEDMEF